MRLVLFDIDGTLVHSGGQAKPAFAEAMALVYGTTGAIETYDFSGKTDGQIVVELLEGEGFERQWIVERLPSLREEYLGRFSARFDPERSRVLPGVRELLERLDGREDVTLALLTGNFERGARIKLEPLGLFGYFHFGSFGDDAIDRRALPPIALDRARRHLGRDVQPEQTLIVGDSLLDVDCAHANGIECLAVASGWTPAEVLAAAQPRWVVESLVECLDHPAFAGHAA